LCEVTITLIPKLDKDTPPTQENYRPISLVNLSTGILNETVQIKIQQHIKKMIKLVSFQGFKDGSIYTNQNHNTGLRRFQDGG
jgi:hypothetical protein